MGRTRSAEARRGSSCASSAQSSTSSTRSVVRGDALVLTPGGIGPLPVGANIRGLGRLLERHWSRRFAQRPPHATRRFEAKLRYWPRASVCEPAGPMHTMAQRPGRNDFTERRARRPHRKPRPGRRLATACGRVDGAENVRDVACRRTSSRPAFLAAAITSRCKVAACSSCPNSANVIAIVSPKSSVCCSLSSCCVIVSARRPSRTQSSGAAASKRASPRANSG